MEWTEAKWEVWHSLKGFFLCQFHLFLGRYFPALPRWSTAGLGRELGCEGEGRSCHKKGTINIHKLPWTASSKINKCYCHFKGKCHFDRSSRNNSVNHFVGSTLFGSLMHVMPRWKQLDSTSQRPQWRISAFFSRKTVNRLRCSGKVVLPRKFVGHLARPPCRLCSSPSTRLLILWQVYGSISKEDPVPNKRYTSRSRRIDSIDSFDSLHSEWFFQSEAAG